MQQFEEIFFLPAGKVDFPVTRQLVATVGLKSLTMRFSNGQQQMKVSEVSRRLLGRLARLWLSRCRLLRR